MKKTYISPATLIMAVQVQQHMLVGSEVFNDPADGGLDVLTQDKGDWDIWGTGSDDDYDDEY